MAHRPKQPDRFARDERTLELFEQLTNDDQDERALALLAESVRGDSHPELRAALRESLSAVGDPERAYELCLGALEQNPKSGPLLFQLGELAVALDKSEEGAKHFGDAQSAGEENPDLYQLWGACEIALGREAHAEELFNTALELAPDRVSEVYSAWGKALCDAGHSAQAQEKLAVAIAADGQAFYPHAYMGVVELQLGHPELAESAFRRALSLVPDGHDAYAAWIVQELAAVIEGRHGGAAAAHAIIDHVRAGRRSLQLLERLRRLQGITPGPRSKRFVLVVAGEDGEGDYYEECEVEADNEEAALGFVRSLHKDDEAAKLVVADLRTTGAAQGPFCGVIDISEKTRVPTDFAGAPSDDDDD